MRKICAILPSHNEEKNISFVIKGVLQYNVDVLVIDDGSTDKTSELARENNVILIRHDKKKGKGVALKEGLIWAVDNGYDYIITIDTDGQHNPDEIPLFIKEADISEQVGIIIGNRLIDPGKMPISRFCTNKLMSYLVSVLCKQDIPDTQCGYRLIKKGALKGISIKSRKFEMESEILVKAARAGYKINSVRIKSIYGDEKSKINPTIDTLRFIRFLIRMTFTK